MFPKSLLTQRRQLRSAYRKCLGLKSSPLYSDYRTQLKKYKHEVREFFRKEEAKVLEQGSIRKFWNFIRRKTRSRPSIPALIHNNSFITDDDAKAELFNKYFSSVFVHDDMQRPLLSTPVKEAISSIDFDVVDVFDTLQKESCKLSKGPDGIPHIVYRKLAAVLACPLYLIYKESLETGSLPYIWKEAKVIPVHKKGPRGVVDNYRPISLTCVACRILERLVRKAIINHCLRHNIITEKQHGFVHRRSTVTQMLECLNCWSQAFENNEIVKVAYLDFKKAFDKVSHPKLLQVLENKGIRGHLLEWIRSFLANRTRAVIVNNARSTLSPVLSGVPQGSVLGPLFFILYINDLANVPLRSEIVLFADDCKLFVKSPKNAIQDVCLQNDLDYISRWTRAMQLSLSVSKCQLLTINGTNDFPFKIEGEKLTDATEVRDLGIIIDGKLKFDAHCVQKVKKAGSVLHFLFTCFVT